MFTPRDAQEALRLAKSAEKARTMFTQDGYTMELLFDEGFPDVFLVSSPTGNHYRVDLSQQPPTCSCPDSQRHPGTFCKHSVGVELELARQEDEWADRMAAEEVEFRCWNPYPHR